MCKHEIPRCCFLVGSVNLLPLLGPQSPEDLLWVQKDPLLVVPQRYCSEGRDGGGLRLCFSFLKILFSREQF